MATTVTVALVGDAETALDTEGIPGLRHPDDWQVPYSERRKIELEVAADETTRSVLCRAADGLDVRRGQWGDAGFLSSAAFYKPEHERAFGPLVSEVTLLNAEDQVRWELRWPDVPYQEILRAGEAGVLDGDPLRPYLVLQPGIGNGLQVDWPTLITAWEVFWEILDKLDVAVGAHAAKKLVIDKLRRRTRNAPEVVRGHYQRWEENGGRPKNMDRFLGQRPWHLEDLAKVLGCTPEQAEAFLLGAGYARAESGLWWRGEDAEAKLLHGNLEFLIQTAMTTRRDEIERVLCERVEAFLETGQAPPLDWGHELGHLAGDGVGLRDPEEVKADQAAWASPPRDGIAQRLWRWWVQRR